MTFGLLLILLEQHGLVRLQTKTIQLGLGKEYALGWNNLFGESGNSMYIKGVSTNRTVHKASTNYPFPPWEPIKYFFILMYVTDVSEVINVHYINFFFHTLYYCIRGPHQEVTLKRLLQHQT